MNAFKRTILLNTSEECEWLRSTHLKGIVTPPFDSFLLEGNEDAPERVGIFREQKPAYNAKPLAIYAQDADGNLVLQTTEKEE